MMIQKNKTKRSVWYHKRISVMMVMVCVLLTILTPIGTLHTKARMSTSYVSNIKIAESSRNIYVTYTAKTVPKGVICSIGYETPRGYATQYKTIRKKGTYTVKWKKIGGVSRVYTRVSAPGYLNKRIIKKIYSVATGTTWHQVTKSEERRGKIIGLSIGLGLGAISLHPELSAYAVKMYLISGVTSTVLTFAYVPTYPNYIKTTVKLNKNSDSIKTTVTVYSHKNGVKLRQWSRTQHIGY